jgi:hypothetical protein
LYTSCVLGLRPSELFNEFLLIKKKRNLENRYCIFYNTFHDMPSIYCRNQLVLEVHIKEEAHLKSGTVGRWNQKFCHTT